MTTRYKTEVPTRSEVDARRGATILEFGSNRCGHCQRAQALIARALASHEGVEHLKIDDGRDRPLGRAYQVKLWPTLLFLANGVEVERLVRPRDDASVREAIARMLERLP